VIKFYTTAPNIFSKLTVFLSITHKICTSSHAPSRKRQITVPFTGHCRTVGPRRGTRFMSRFWPLKERLKSLPGAFSTLRPHGSIVFLSQQVPAFISRGATHHTDARDLYQRRRELPPNFASETVIYKNR
jgi:hypothetical protein